MESGREMAKVKREKWKNKNYCCCFTIYFSRQFQLLILICCLLLASGCEQSFHPIKKNNQYAFSVYGYLDASVDTQWVRVTPAREQVSMPDRKSEMTVMLEELETGTRSVMRDSLFQQANGFNFVNVWTTMDIKPGHTYRLQARRPDGVTSSVTVSTPQKFPVPKLTYFGDECYARLYVRGVKHLIDIQSVWNVKLKGSGWEDSRLERFNYRDEIKKLAPEDYRVLINAGDEYTKVIPASAEAEIYERYLFVAAGGPEWDQEITSLTNIEYALPKGHSNIENGMGYLMGIVSKKVPYTKCLP